MSEVIVVMNEDISVEIAANVRSRDIENVIFVVFDCEGFSLSTLTMLRRDKRSDIVAKLFMNFS